MDLYLKEVICKDCGNKIRIGTEDIRVNGKNINFVLWSCRLGQCNRKLFLITQKHNSVKQ